MVSIDLSGETAVVTGVLGRLGRVWTWALMAAGADVFGVDTAETCPDDEFTGGAGGRFRYHRTDVTDRSSVDRSLAACVEHTGGPSILVNNAGIDSPPVADKASWLFRDIPDDLSGAILDVNAIGALRMCQAFGSAMADRGRGSIINIGSIYAGVAPAPQLYTHLPIDPPFLKAPAYGMSKAGVAALTRYLAVLWAPAGVRVNTLSPGGVRGGQDARFREKYADRVPMRRMAEAYELTGPLLFLASPLSSYVTGHELVVDGGFTCW